MSLRRLTAAETSARVLRIVGAASLAPQGDDKAALRKFRMAAYNGGLYRFPWSSSPVVLDLAGLEITDKARPILKDHDTAQVVGHSTAITKADTLTVEGVVSGTGPSAVEVVANSDNGFPWQASIGADVLSIEDIAHGVSVTINGQSFTGPLAIVRSSRLAEVSFVALGNDDTTTAELVAHKNPINKPRLQGSIPMDFTAWIKSLGLDPETLSDEAKAVLTKAYEAEQAAAQAAADKAEDAPAKAQAARSLLVQAIRAAAPAAKPVGTDAASVAVQAARTAAADEVERIAKIRRLAASHPEIEARAIREGWTGQDTEVAVLRADRAQVPNINLGSSQADANSVLTAAVLQAGRSRDLAAGFAPQVLEAADKRFKGRISLGELLLEAAWANGYTGRSIRGDLPGVLRAAFALKASGFSSVDLPGILSNSMNKFLLTGWNAVEQSWKQIAAVRPVNDFKTSTSYRMGGNAEYEKVNGSGEIKHGTLTESAYPIKADTYARMLAVTRQDMINDDLGAITTAPQALGRGAALKFNDVFWSEFLNNSTFFASGNANAFAGSPGSLLGLDGMSTAETMLLNQTDPDGKPLGISPRLLLVPPALKATAEALYRSTEVRDTTASTKTPTANPHAGKFAPVVSAYLSNAKYTGNSATAWYLLADPADLAVMEAVFLNGQEAPTVETADADFSTLGIQMRGYHDFGVAKHEFRAGIRAKGAA